MTNEYAVSKEPVTRPYLAAYLASLLSIVVFAAIAGSLRIGPTDITGYLGGALGLSVLPWFLIRIFGFKAGAICLLVLLLGLAQAQFNLVS